MPRIELEPTEDVLRTLAARRRPGQLLVGFAAEHGEGAVQFGRDKLERKHLDAIVVNDVSQPGIGFDSAENEVTIVLAGGASPAPGPERGRRASPTASSMRWRSC